MDFRQTITKLTKLKRSNKYRSKKLKNENTKKIYTATAIAAVNA